MRRRSSLVTASILAIVALASLGATDCSEQIGSVLIETVANHEERLDDLERCDCEGVLAPVCGENGKTYVNVCEARCAGTEVASIGRCDRPECGGPHGISCGDGAFCETRPGCDAMAAGICVDVPEVCTDEYDPVCGCDGKTYSNDCQRRAAGIALDFRDSCEHVQLRCTGNADCSETEYCHKRDGVCGEGLGACTLRPDACTLDYDPVCGCDEKTYSNACAAAAAGVSVLHDGACEPGPVACEDNQDCDDDEFCRKPIGECRNEGLCAPRPQACPLYIDEVCGCDGRTYGNECEASNAGVSIADDEACEPPKVAICHIPPGNPGNRHTIHVGASAVDAHLRHGDHRGPCEHDDD